MYFDIWEGVMLCYAHVISDSASRADAIDDNLVNGLKV